MITKDLNKTSGLKTGDLIIFRRYQNETMVSVSRNSRIIFPDNKNEQRRHFTITEDEIAFSALANASAEELYGIALLMAYGAGLSVRPQGILVCDIVFECCELKSPTFS